MKIVRRDYKYEISKLKKALKTNSYETKLTEIKEFLKFSKDMPRHFKLTWLINALVTGHLNLLEDRLLNREVKEKIVDTIYTNIIEAYGEYLKSEIDIKEDIVNQCGGAYRIKEEYEGELKELLKGFNTENLFRRYGMTYAITYCETYVSLVVHKQLEYQY